MKTIIIFLFCYIYLVLSENIINKDVVRTIDATNSVVKILTEIRAINLKGSYDLIYHDLQASHLSYLSVTLKGKPGIELKVNSPVTNGNYSTFTIPIQDNEAYFRIKAVFTNILDPYPKEIYQADPQLVLLKESHVLYTPYFTETQKTTFKLASSLVESYTKRTPNALKGSSLVYGSYKDIPPFEYSPVTIHFGNNKPFAKFTSVNREVEVSHWGNVAFEEVFELQHAGAKLKGGFSRFDYMMKRQVQSPSYRNLIATLPVQAHDIYYRDQIGNISTSDIRKNNDNGEDYLELDIQTRFPMFGGWQTQFYIGYSLPTESVLFLDENGKYNLKFNFFTIFEDVWVEEMEIKIVLPEGSTNIAVNVPYTVEQSNSKRFTYLDSEFNGGRPVIILKGKNFVEDHDEEIVISYDFSTTRMIVEPLMLVLAYFAFFIICSIVVRMDKTTSKKDI